MQSSQNILAEITAPPDALSSRNPMRWLRFFGPGAIIASCTIGSGEVLFSTRGGAIFGYHILWIFLAASLMKWVLCYSSMRHVILSGAHPFQRWNHLPGPHGWFPLFMVGVAFFAFPIWYSFLSGVLGTACKWVFGPQEIFMGHDTYCWASIALVLAMIVLLIGNYQALEFAQVVLVFLMLACMVLAVVVLRPDVPQVVSGLFVPSAPVYPDWVKELEEFRERTPLLEVIVYVGAIGGGSLDYIAYLSFLREKRWGAADLGVLSDEALKVIDREKNHRARRWIRAAVVDTVISFGAIAFLAACFSILGTVVLAPQQLVPKSEELLNLQAQFLAALAPWIVPIYKAAIFAAFLSILYGGPELNFRVVIEFLNSTERLRDRFSQRKLRVAFIIWVLTGGLVLLWVSWTVKQYVRPEFSLVGLISPAGVYTGVLTCGFYCLLNPWMDWKFLPRALRMNWLLVGLNLVAGAVFISIGVKALWDDWWYTAEKWHAFLFLGGLVLVAMFAARQFRYHLYDMSAGQPRPLMTSSI